MNNLPFVFWMLGWPLVNSVEEYIYFLKETTFTDEVNLFFSLFMIIVYVAIAKLLYRSN